MTKVMPWTLHRPESETVVHLVLLVWGVCSCSCAKNDSFQTVNVAKLATLTHGAELVFLEDVFEERAKTYRLEDFFWTGSGDGSDENGDGDQWGGSDKTTVYKTIDRTKTVLSTVYVGKPSTGINQTDIAKCSVNCEPTLTPQGDIKPTPTYDSDYDNSTDDDDALDADRQFWLLTVLKSDGKDPVLLDLKNSLAKLYKTAFQRQQERHLGIEYRTKREATPTDKPVKVYIHNVAKSPVNGDEKIDVLYHVSVSGQPVPASTAAEDMRLVSDLEVTEELGYPFLIKAEPFLKPAAPLSLSSSKNTWLFIGSSLVVLFLLLLAVAFLTLCFTKRKKPNLALGMGNRRQIFEQRIGQDGMTYVGSGERETKRIQSAKRQDQSPTYINFRTQTSNETLKSGVEIGRPLSASSTTTISTSSLDISPLMGLHRQRTPPGKKSRVRGAINKTVPLNVRHYPMGLADSDTSSEDTTRISPDPRNYANEVVSPKSYLSMPSVKAFPRGNIPEPLNKVLEPVSVLHLDMADDVGLEEPIGNIARRQPFSRHGSMTATEDPGVLGPVVWNMHCQRLQNGVSTDEGTDDFNLGSNVTKMRKRFHDLLDDTFSLFSSRKESPIDESRQPPSEVKSHSAVNSRSSDDLQPTIRPRPKTSDPRRVVGTPGSEPPRGAWSSHAPSPLVRPLSASVLYRPPVRPKIDVTHILAEGTLPPNDPAIPLIAAIKSEIGKCSLPGSTTNLIDD